MTKDERRKLYTKHRKRIIKDRFYHEPTVLE